MNEFILEKNLISAKSVKNHLTDLQILNLMNLFILEENLLNARSAINHLIIHHLFQDKKELILEKNLVNLKSLKIMLIIIELIPQFLLMCQLMMIQISISSLTMIQWKKPTQKSIWSMKNQAWSNKIRSWSQLIIWGDQ